jgi:hypothetical protein
LPLIRSTITDFNRTDAQLERFFMDCVVGAVRPTRTVSRQVEELLALLAREHDQVLTPFALLNLSSRHAIEGALKRVGIGCYSQKAATLAQTAGCG